MAKAKSSTSAGPSTKDVVITVEIQPVDAKTHARRVVVSGAREGEMPVVEQCVFGDLHSVIDRVWVAVLQSKECNLLDAKADAKAVLADDEEESDVKPDEVREETPAAQDDVEPDDQKRDQLVALDMGAPEGDRTVVSRQLYDGTWTFEPATEEVHLSLEAESEEN